MRRESHLEQECKQDEVVSFLNYKQRVQNIKAKLKKHIFTGCQLPKELTGLQKIRFVLKKWLRVSVVGVWASTLVAVFMRSMEVIDGVHGVELDLCQVFVTDPVQMRRALAGRRPRHLASSWDDEMCRRSGVSSNDIHTTTSWGFITYKYKRKAYFWNSLWPCCSWQRWVECIFFFLIAVLDEDLNSSNVFALIRERSSHLPKYDFWCN